MTFRRNRGIWERGLQAPSPFCRMKLFCCCLAFLLCLPASSMARRRVAEEPRRNFDALLVAFQPNSPIGKRAAALNSADAVIDNRRITGRFVRVLAGARALARFGKRKALLDLAARIARDPAVRRVEPDWEVSAFGFVSDPRFRQQWHLQNTGQDLGLPGADVDAKTAWRTSTGSAAVRVAVLDTGIDYNHPDLTSNLARDPLGALVGFDFINNDRDPWDDQGHGTHVAGILGAQGNNGIGISGLAQRVSLLPVKVLDDRGHGSIATVIQGIDYAVNAGCRVINMSWGGPESSALLLESLQRAESRGVLAVAACGNSASNNDIAPIYPSSYTLELSNILSVAATDRWDETPRFSNYGKRSVDIAAPGDEILSCVRGGSYQAWDGTSMAAPLVSGAAALLLSRYPDLSLRMLRSRLLAGAVVLPQLEGRIAGGRRLNAAIPLGFDFRPPLMPVGARIEAIGADAAALAWRTPEEPAADRAVFYEIRFHPGAGFAGAFEEMLLEGPRVAAAPPGVVQHALMRNLAPNKAYVAAIRAVDAHGNGSPEIMLGPVTTLASDRRVTLLRDDAEGIPAFFGDGTWSLSTERSASPVHAYTDSPGVPSSPMSESSLTQSSSVTLAGLIPELLFQQQRHIEAQWDQLQLETSTDGGVTWISRGRPWRGSAPWTLTRVDLSDLYGEDLLLRFRLKRDTSDPYDGVWLDDLEISGSALDALPPPSGPAAPTDLTASAAGRTAVELRWSDNSRDEDDFELERMEPGGVWVSARLAPSNSVQVADEGLAPGTAYRYRIRARSAAGVSGWSNLAGASTLPNLPAKIINLTATSDDRGVVLFWTADARATGYHIYRADSEAGEYRRTGTVGAPSFADLEAQDGRRYYYRVTGWNEGGEGEPSDPLAVDVAAIIRPPAPVKLRGRMMKQGVKLTWRTKSRSGISGYRVYRSETLSNPPALFAAVEAVPRYLDRSIVRGGRYTYFVTSVDTAGRESLPSSRLNLTVR